MYICLCHAVTENAIKEAVRDGARSLADLGFQTGAGTQCGSCVPQARQIISAELRRKGWSPGPVELRIVSNG